MSTLILPYPSTHPDLYHGKYVAGMFGSGEQGVWYDPSDKSTLFQDVAGTIPVTAVEQPVGRMLDKSGRGNHATQATTASRPVLSARVNLLTNTEAFDNFVWSPTTRIVVTANDAINPNGLQNADKITETSENGTHRVTQNVVFSQNTQYTFSCHWKKGTRRWVWISINNAADNCNQFFDLDSLSLGVSQQVGLSVEKVSASIHDAGSGWVFCRFTARTGTLLPQNAVFTGMALSDGVNSYVGSASEYGFIWGADLRVANTGVNLPAYQRVNTATDYDTTGFKPYLSFDGVDDYLSTGSINFTATDKMTVLAGVRKLRDSPIGTVVEASTNSETNDGAFFMTAPPGGGNTFLFGSRSTQLFYAYTPVGGVWAAPISVVQSGISEIPSKVNMRLNGALAAQQLVSQGTGKYGNYPLYIGRRGGTTNPFAGNLYGLIVRGAQTDDAHLTHAEKYLAYKSGVTL